MSDLNLMQSLYVLCIHLLNLSYFTLCTQQIIVLFYIS